MNQTKNIKAIILTVSFILGLTSCEIIETDVVENPCSLQTSENHPNADSYQRIIDEYLSAGVPGISATVISSEGIWSATGGKSDLKNMTNLTSCNVMRIASATKVFTSTTILKLHELRILNINDKINKYIPHTITNEINNANNATIRQLLNHTSGIKDYLGVSTVLDILNLSIKNYSASDYLELIYGEDAEFKPGTKFKYSNSNYLLLGMVIKYATRKSAYETIWDILVDPLPLENTYQGNNIPSHLSRGYYDIYDNNYMKDMTEIDNNVQSGNNMVDGGIISSSYDMATFLNSLFAGQIISQESLNLMQTWEDVTPSGNLELVSGYGLGLQKIKTDQGIGIGHYGRIYSFSSLLFYFPDHNTTLAVTINGYSANIGDVHFGEKIFEYLFNN